MEVAQGEVERPDLVDQVEVAVRVDLYVLERACLMCIVNKVEVGAPLSAGTLIRRLSIRDDKAPPIIDN